MVGIANLYRSRYKRTHFEKQAIKNGEVYVDPDKVVNEEVTYEPTMTARERRLNEKSKHNK